MITNLNDVSIETDIDKVALLVRKLGLKQYQFAEVLGYTPAYFESVLNGRSPLTKSFINRINKYLECKYRGE